MQTGEGAGRSGSRAQVVALASVGVGVVLVVVKLVAGLLTGSLGLISEAVHSCVDVAASAFAYLAVRASRRPADSEHPYGHGRTENLAAFMEGVLLLLTAGGIAVEASRRLASQHSDVHPASYALAIMVFAIVVEAGRGAVLKRVARSEGSEALSADADNRLADVLSSAGVLIGLIAVRAGQSWADPAAAAGVALVLGWTAIRILRHSGDILIDRAAAGAEHDLRRAIAGVPGIRDVRTVRVRRSGAQLLGEATVATRRMLSLEAARALGDVVRLVAARAVPNLELTLVVEGQPEASDLVERVHAAAARHGQVRDLHNVTVERESDGSLHLTMHVKLPGELRLEEAAKVSAALERSLREELTEISRVDVHLEPLEPELVRGQDVTRARPSLAGRIKELVEKHPDVVHCRDVELSSRHGTITAHVVAQMPNKVSLQHAHAVETQLEEEIRREMPEIQEVVARAST